MITATAATFARIVSRHVLEAYVAREMELFDILEMVDQFAARCTASDRLAIIGELAIRALYAKRRKETNRSKPPYPAFLKEMAVGFALLFEEFDADPAGSGNPNRRAALNREHAIAMLAELGLLPVKPGGKLLSEATLRRWCEDRKRALGKASPRGRPSKKKMHALS